MLRYWVTYYDAAGLEIASYRFFAESYKDALIKAEDRLIRAPVDSARIASITIEVV